MLLAVQEPDDSIGWVEALIPMVGIGAILMIAGAFTITTAHRLAAGRVAKNGVLGIRTRASLSSDEAWLAAQQAGEPHLVRSGWTAAVTGPVALAVGAAIGAGDAERALVGWTVVLLLGVTALTVLAVRGAVVGHRAARTHVDQA